MKQEWVAIFVTLVLLLIGLTTLLRIVLRSARQKPFSLPELPDGRILFPIGPHYSGNDEVAAKDVGALLSGESTVIVALVYEVPRAIALEKAEPEEEATALHAKVQQVIAAGGHACEQQVIPCRNSVEEVLRLIGTQRASGVFVRLDPQSESDLMGTLLQRAGCTVFLSHVQP